MAILIDIPLEAAGIWSSGGADGETGDYTAHTRGRSAKACLPSTRAKEGTIVNGTIQRIDGRIVFVDLGSRLERFSPVGAKWRVRIIVSGSASRYILRVEAGCEGSGITALRAHAENGAASFHA